MKNNYLIGVPTLRSWCAFLVVALMTFWLPVSAQSKLSGYGTYSSPALSYSSTGAGGWSAPSGVILGGGFQHAGGATVYAAFPAQPGTAYPHYTYGPTEYGWNVYNGGTPGNITVHGIHASMPPGYGILTQTINGFSSGGWAGWSVPAGKVILGGGYEANGPVSVSCPAGPNTVWPHYTYGANEYGWVVRSAGATSITIHAIYADMPHGYEIVKSVALNYSGNGWAGWSQQNGKVVTGGGFELPGPAAASRPGLPSQTTPFGYTYASDEYGWLVQNGGTAGTGYIYAIYASQQFPVEIFRNGNFVSGHMTIQGAINAAQAGDVIEVGAGSYTENLIINKANLTVRANGTVTINDVATPANWSGWSGPNMPGRDPVVFIKANGVTFEGFNIRDYQQKAGSPYIFSVVRVEGDNVTVKGLDMQSQYDANYLASASYELIVVAKGSNVVVRDNVLQRTKQNTLGTAIVKLEREIAPGDIVGNVLLKNNTVNGGPVAIRLNPNATITVEDNTLSNVNFEGLWVALQPGASTSGHLVFTNNTVSNFNVTCGSCRAIKVAAKPASINGQTNSGSMLSVVQAANTGVSSWLFEWMGPVCNVTQDQYYTTIQSAVNASTAGDVITVAAGTYNEAVLLNKAISLQGANYGIAAGNQPGTRVTESIVVGGFNITAAATVDGFTVRTGFAFAGTGGVGVAVAYPGVTITNTIIENVTANSAYGLTTSLFNANPLNNLTFTNNTVRNNYMGMYLNPGVGHVFTGNLIDNNSGIGIGIGSDGLSNFTFTGNTVSNHSLEGWGISSVGANVVANNNTFLGKGIFHYGGQTIDATCNWWGQATGPVSGQNSGSLTTAPYQTSSSLNACDGTPVVISSATATNGICGTAGSITVSFSGGTGPYNIAWTGGSASGVTSPYTITGLAAGSYTATVTDAYGSAATTSSISIAYLPVQNTTTGNRYATIQSAINAATAGDNIEICAGTYNETLTVDKLLTLDGAGAATIINTTTSGAKAMTVTASGASSSSRLVIKDMAFTGPSNTSGSDAISFEPSSGSGAYVTVENVSSSAHGVGVHFRSGTMTDAKILNCTLNGNGFGVRVASAVTSMDGLVIDGCTMNNNNSSAISVNPSGTLSNVNTNYTVSNSTFANNSTAGVTNQHDLSFFGFTGNASLSNVTLNSGNGSTQNSNSYGIVFTRGSGSGPLGTVSLNNVTVSGHVGKGAITFQLYNDISGVSMNNVDVSNCVAPWGQVILSHTDADAFSLGNTTLKSLVLWTTGGADATSAVFKHATSNAVLDRNVLADCFQMEDQTAHKTDNAALGHARLKAGNVYVTTISVSIQRGVDAASVGDIVNVQAGAYTGNLNVNKSVALRGPNHTVAYSGTRAAEAVIDGNVVVSSTGASFSGFEMNRTYLPAMNWLMEVSSGGTTVSNNIIKIGTVQTSTQQGFIRLNTTSGTVTFSGNEFKMATPGSFPANTGINGLLTQGSGTYNITGNRIAVSGGPTQDADAVGITGGTVLFDGNIVEGDIMGGVTAYGNFGNVTISNNQISNYTAQLAGIRAVGCCGFNAATGFVTINNNKVNSSVSGTTGIGIIMMPAANILSLSNNDLSDNQTAISHSSGSGTLAATCNWYGSTNANTIASRISGNVTFSPWLIDGTDGNAATGFQPSGACSGTAPAIASSVTNVSCFGLANGAIDITVSGGTAPYAYSWSNAETTEDLSGVVAGAYTVIVSDDNGSTVSASFTITQPAPPSAAGAIVGIATECRSGVAASEPFSVPASNNATTYTWAWSGTSGVTISNNGNQNITLDYTATAIQGGVIGTLTVTPYDICGNAGASSSVAVEYQGTTPVTPASISGDGKMCPGDIKTYSIAAVSRATYYTWSIPANTSITGGAGTNVISLTVASGYTGGDITVAAGNVCGISPVRTKSVVTNLPGTPGTITGLSSGQCNAAGVSYSIPAVTGASATGYTWTISGGSVASGQGTTAIAVNWTNTGTSGSVSVTSSNACGTSGVRSVTVSKVPARPNAITGVTVPACTSSVVTASVASVTGASSYTWAITSGGSITGGQGTKDATVTWGAAVASSQSITARAANSCGNSLTRALTGISVVACSREQAANGNALQMLVYPNPAHDWMMLNFTTENEQRYQIRLTDMSGRAVLVQDGTSDAGSNQLQLTPGSISSGVYMLHLSIGDQQAVQRIVIQ